MRPRAAQTKTIEVPQFASDSAIAARDDRPDGDRGVSRSPAHDSLVLSCPATSWMAIGPGADPLGSHSTTSFRGAIASWWCSPPAVAVDRDHTTVTAARPERRHPQGNGGDMDAENNGGPSDGDGSV